MHRPRRGWLLPTTALGLVASLGLAACGSAAPATTGAGSTASGAPAKGITLKVSQYTWTAAAVTDGILAAIAQKYPELGVASVQPVQLDPAPAWAGAQRGDIDVLTEVAMPNQQALADKSKAEVSLVSKTYGGASQGWFVPAYAVEPGGPAAGLTSVTQLNSFKNVFGGKLYDADPGWLTTKQNAKRLAGYGIQYQHVTSSEAAELAQLKSAYERKQPILVYLYHPHWVFTEFKMVQLKEPTPYSADCLTTGNGACAMPEYAAWIAARKDLAQRAPKFAGMLKSFTISLTDMEQMMAKVDVQKQPVASVAQDWVNANSAQINAWITKA